MSEQTLELLATIRQRLQTTARRTTLADLAYGALVSVAFLATAWLLGALVEGIFWLAPGPRTVLATTLVIVALALLGYYVARPLLRLAGVFDGPSEQDIARRIGRRYPEVSDRLVNLLDLSEGRSSHSPPSLVDRAVQTLGEDVRNVSFEEVEDFSRARRVGRFAAAPVLLLLVVLLAAPSGFLDATQRLLAPGERFARPMPFTLSVEPGNAALVRGDSLTVRVRAVGEQLPRSLTLQLSNEGEQHVEEVSLTPTADGTFSHTLVNVRTPLRYRALAAPATTEWFAVDLTDRPVLRDLRVTLDFPDYTGMPDQRLAPNVGDVTALPGTRVQLEAGLGGADVEEALAVFEEGRRDTLDVDGAQARGVFTLDREGTYHLELRSENGISNRDPITYSRHLLRDETPSIVLLRPQETVSLDESMRTPLRMRLSDDFGFVRLRLYYRLSESRFKETAEDFTGIDLPLHSPRQLDQEVLYDWLLKETTPLRLAPGDVVDYFVRVWDNDAVAGYKSAETPVQQLTLPSLAEQYEQLDQQQDETEERFEEMSRQAESMREQFEELRDELRRKPQADWEDERQVERLQQRQQQMQQQADQITRQLEEMTREMKRNDLVDEQTVQLYEELQRVADEINSPELEQALKQLQQALQNMDPQQMQQALENFEFNEQQYQQRLERTLELFKKIRMQQQLNEMARRAEELARQQEELGEQTEDLRREQGEDVTDEEQQEGNEGSEQHPDSSDGDEDAGEGEEGEPRESEGNDGERSQEGENLERRGDDAEGGESESPQGDQQQQQPQGQQQSQDGSSEDQRREQLAQQQDRSSEEMKALEEELQKLREEMEEMASGPKQEMRQLEQQMQQQQLSKQMQQNSEQLRQNQLQQAQQQQQQMQQQLQQMQQQLQQMQAGMQGQQMQINIAAMRRVLTDVLTLSEQQESLRLRVQGTDGESPALRDFARRQSELSDGLGVVADTLQKLAKEIPQMRREVQREAGESLREMSGATDAMSDSQSGRATGHQKASMMHLNELALMLSELLGQMQRQGGGGGGMSMQQMQQQMQQMSQQQQGLNQQIQQMLNDAQGNRLSVDQQRRLEQMGRQQQAIKRQLEELSRSRHAKGNLLGDLQRIAEQMDETIREMQQRQLDRRTVERQQQILTRLLDAQKSLRTQGREDRREGQTGREYERNRPGELTPPEEAERLRRALIRAIESGYAPDYEELIKRYFDLLQQQQDGESGPDT